MRQPNSQLNIKPALVSVSLAIAIPCLSIGLLVSCNTGDRPKSDLSSQKLSGTWEFKNQDGAKAGTAIFDTKNGIDGDVYILSNDLPVGKTAIAGKYKANPNKYPPELDLTFGDLTTQTIYEIGNDGQLKIANAVPDQPRPTTLDAHPQLLTKVSDNTNIDRNIKILRSSDLAASSALIHEAESKSYIRAIMRSQQQIFQEKGQFSTDVNQLASGLKLNSEFYNYQATVLDIASGLVVLNTAIPVKDGLKAYTGIVYAIANDTNQRATKLLLCESNIPAKAIPPSPKKQDEDYSCPDAYIRINP
ncbi:type IV pilin-like G/H family protein [Pseudanabaena sp. ABRG5-3]|uniref:type IV pilin-like G/H family protein n=1 Tax=Pseudanabaena sp. ABRG5-3 TaxID=685565 RepID=UPI000DC71066|nr:type IV pilin-like G/H family protein [Pseudanabaena sp. ABRG5-3]BBC24691.1 general secretion pathway protein H [Pseudanabaena sp. ABRG5-3]